MNAERSNIEPNSNLNTNREARTGKRERHGSLGVVEIPPIFFRHARQKLEERVEAPIERAAQLGNRAVDRVQGESGLAVLQAKTGLVGPTRVPSGTSRMP